MPNIIKQITGDPLSIEACVEDEVLETLKGSSVMNSSSLSSSSSSLSQVGGPGRAALLASEIAMIERAKF